MEEKDVKQDVTPEEKTLNIPEPGFKNSVVWFFKRGLAVIIDNFIVVSVAALFFGILSMIFNVNVMFNENALFNIAILFYCVYYTFMLGKYGQTLGKKVFSLMVVNDDGTRFGYGKAFLRLLATVLSHITLLIGYLIMFFNRNRKTLHDYIVGTVVVKKG